MKLLQNCTIISDKNMQCLKVILSVCLAISITWYF